MKRLLGLALLSTLAVTGCNGSGGVTIPGPTGPVPTVASTFTAGITVNAALFDAVSGPDGRIWFSEFSGNKVAAVTMAGVVTEYPAGAGSQPLGIVVASDGNIWTGGFGGVIDRITTAGVVTPYPVAGAHIGQMTIGADGNIWFGDYGNNKVGKITILGVVSEFALPAGGRPFGIASGSDGNLWVNDYGDGFIRKLSTAGAVLNSYSTGLSIPTYLQYIVSAPDGNLYFTESRGNVGIMDHVGKITTAGTITELAALAPTTSPNTLTVGKDGNVYFTESGKQNLGRIFLSSGAVSEFPLVLLGADTTNAIAAGPDGRLWLGGFQTIYAVTY